MSKYFTTEDICDLFKITKVTLWRWQTKTPYGKPFPAPALSSPGGAPNRYLVSDVIDWENECIQNKKTAV